MNSDNELLPLTIAEDIPSAQGPITVTLEKSEAPHGRPRERAIYERGVSIEGSEIRLPGRRRPIYQMRNAAEKPLAFRGAFRDHLVAEDRGAAATSNALDREEVLNRIARRMNPVVVTRGSDQWFGVLWETNFGHEGLHDITYELTFKVSSEAGVTQTTPDDAATADAPPASAALGDLAAAVAADIAARAAEMAALRVRASVSLTMAIVATSLDLAAAAAADLVDAAVALDTASADAPPTAGAVERLDTIAAAAAARCSETEAAAGLVTLATAVPLAQDVGARLATAALLANLSGTLRDSRATVRELRLRNRAALATADRIYVVRADDTLEGIAARELGSSARAHELGVRQDQLRAGLWLRLAGAA